MNVPREIIGRELTGGLIGEHISRTRLPAALQILCAEYGYELNFELIDSANRTPFRFSRHC